MSDIDTGVVDGLKALDPDGRIREAAVSDRSKQCSYSITSSARASSVGGTSMPSVFAVLWLITSSYFVGGLHRQMSRLLTRST